MKKWFVFALFVPMLAFGQGRIQAFSVNVETNHLSHVVMGTDSLHRTNLVSRYQFSVQHLAEALDARWGQAEYDWGFSTNGWTVLLPSNGTAQATLNFIDAEMGTARVNMTNLLNAQGVINTNFTNLSNAFVSLQGTINTNADQSRTNALIANWNQGNISNLIGQALHNVYRSFTNIPGMATNPAYTNAASTNFGWSYSWKPEGTNFLESNFDLALGFVDLASAFTGYSDSQTAPISNALASVTLDGAYVSYWGYTTNANNRTLTTNVYLATNGAVDYVFSFPTNSAGSYASVNAGGPFSLDVVSNRVTGVVISEPGRYQVGVQLRLSDITPAYTATNASLEGSFLYTLRWYDGNTPINWWRAIGRMVPPSAQSFVPPTEVLDVAGYGPPGYYETQLFFLDTFLVTTKTLAAYTNGITLRVMAGYAPASISGTNAYHMVRSASITALRTATW